MTVHVCETCGHEVHYMGELASPIEHLPDGGHRWTVKLSTGGQYSKKALGVKFGEDP